MVGRTFDKTKCGKLSEKNRTDVTKQGVLSPGFGMENGILPRMVLVALQRRKYGNRMGTGGDLLKKKGREHKDAP